MRRATAAREVALRSGTTRALGFAEAGGTFAAKQIIHVLHDGQDTARRDAAKFCGSKCGV